MLYPYESEAREIKNLSGIWEFRIDTKNEGRRKKWFAAPLAESVPMAVPSSYNDISQEAAVRDHIGDAWYQQTTFVPLSWETRRVVLRVGSATHHAVVWVNGREVMCHKGGYLPFEADISPFVRFGAENRITVVVNNELDWTCIPPGNVKEMKDPDYPKGYRVQEYFHDFFNYSGIHRPVVLYTTPKIHIRDITVKTDIRGQDGLVSFQVELGGGKRDVVLHLLDAHGVEKAKGEGRTGQMIVSHARLWNVGKPYLYTLEVTTITRDKSIEDCYRLPIGIRSIKIAGKKFLINGKPFYFKGFGKHEDMEVKGKGLDHAMLLKDFSLMKWIGANSIRTSHYPYSEEFMSMADREGIAVIDESPAVGMNLWNKHIPLFCKERISTEALTHHLNVMSELVERDKNHPCVVLWSVANEATTYEKGAEPYFRKVASHTRKLDPTRPITIVNSSRPGECRVAGLFDVVCVNRYNSWYVDCGHLEVIELQLQRELKAWYKRFGKPVIMSEYGADVVEGIHASPAVVFSEEYQCEMLNHFHKVFDRLDFVVGEHVWNFSDFMTKQDLQRVNGNRKGVFTRQRQPKMAGHMLRERWTRGKAKA